MPQDPNLVAGVSLFQYQYGAIDAHRPRGAVFLIQGFNTNMVRLMLDDEQAPAGEHLRFNTNMVRLMPRAGERIRT